MLVYALYYLLLVNNVYFRYHRTLKDVGLNSRLSLGTLIGKILKVKRVHIRKSKHADFDQQLKVHTRVPDVLQSFAHTVSPYILRHMMEQHEKKRQRRFLVAWGLAPHTLCSGTDTREVTNLYMFAIFLQYNAHFKIQIIIFQKLLLWSKSFIEAISILLIMP